MIIRLEGGGWWRGKGEKGILPGRGADTSVDLFE